MLISKVANIAAAGSGGLVVDTQTGADAAHEHAWYVRNNGNAEATVRPEASPVAASSPLNAFWVPLGSAATAVAAGASVVVKESGLPAFRTRLNVSVLTNGSLDAVYCGRIDSL